MIISVPLAILAASRKDAIRDHAVRVIPLLGLGMPAFWLALILQSQLSVRYRLFPVTGYGTGFAGHLHSMFLPSLTVAIALCPVIIRSLRASMLDVLGADFITTARAKGVPASRLFIRHVLRNAIIPAVTVLGINIGFLIGGTLIVEQVFGLPGVGSLLIQSIFARDFPVVQAVALVFGIMVVLVNLLDRRGLRDPRPKSEVRQVSAISIPAAEGSPGSAPQAAGERAQNRRSRWYRQPTLMAGLVITGLILFLVIAAPLLTSYNPDTQNFAATLQGPSAHHLLGTDQLGRDTWTPAALRRADRPADRVHRRAAAVRARHDRRQPGRLLRRLGGHRHHAIGRHRRRVPVLRADHRPGLRARPGRAQHLHRDHAGRLGVVRPHHPRPDPGRQASGVRGSPRSRAACPAARIMARHLLPNVISQAIVYALSVDIEQDILAIVTLSYLGLGIQPPAPDWGTMISDGQNFLTTHWQLTTIPGLAVVVTGLGLSLLADGLADLLRLGQS